MFRKDDRILIFKKVVKIVNILGLRSKLEIRGRQWVNRK